MASTRWAISELTPQFDVAGEHALIAPCHVTAVIVPVDVVGRHREDGAGQLAAGGDDFGWFAVGGDEAGVGEDVEDPVDVGHVGRGLQ